MMQQQVCFSDISNSRLSQNGRRDSVKFGTPVVLLGSASLQLSMTCCSLFKLTKQTLNIMQPIPTTKNIKKYICRCVTSAVGAAPACLYSYDSHFRGGALGVGCTSSCSKRWRKSFTAMVLYKVLLMVQKSG